MGGNRWVIQKRIGFACRLYGGRTRSGIRISSIHWIEQSFTNIAWIDPFVDDKYSQKILDFRRNRQRNLRKSAGTVS